jgi:hypothetical protein
LHSNKAAAYRCGETRRATSALQLKQSYPASQVGQPAFFVMSAASDSPRESTPFLAVTLMIDTFVRSQQVAAVQAHSVEIS